MIKCDICGSMFDCHDKENCLDCMERIIQNMQGLKDQLVKLEETGEE